MRIAKVSCGSPSGLFLFARMFVPAGKQTRSTNKHLYPLTETGPIRSNVMPNKARLAAEYADLTPQSIESIDKDLKQSIGSINNNRLDTRVQGLHISLRGRLNDDNYDIAHTYKIAKLFSDAEIYKVAEYCQRKADKPGRAFVTIFKKKLNNAA